MYAWVPNAESRRFVDAWQLFAAQESFGFGGTLEWMAILVDDAIWPFRGDTWAHLVSDESYEELHAFVDRLGPPRRAFQGDHYDVPRRVREEAVRLGAEPVCSRELVRRLRAAGLRRGPVRFHEPAHR
jgi:hypothetical protein